MNPLISIIIPIYNVDKFLKTCINSVLSQTYENIEIILINDGSTDNSVNICNEYEKKDKRIKVINQTNMGLSGARNSGINIALGEYITFVDSDDFLAPNMLQTLYNLCEIYNADCSVCSHIRCNETDTLANLFIQLPPKSINIYENNKMKVFLEDVGIGTTAWAKLYKKVLFKEVRYPVGKYHEDVFTTYKLVHLANRITTTNEIGYIYRQTPNSITNEGFSIKRLDSIYGKIEQTRFIEQKYPSLVPYAYLGIIYACNQCLLQMGKTKFKNNETDKYLKALYKKYIRYYLKSNASVNGKMFALLARLNYNFTKWISRYF